VLQTMKNAWRTEELRKKLIFTFFILLVFRIGSVIPVPFINIERLGDVFRSYSEGLFGFIDIMSGGAFSKATLFAMSITPYINSSIIMNLLCIGIPALEKISKDGEEGRKKIASWTRYVTVGLALIQGLAYYLTLNSQALIINPGWWTMVVVIMSFTAGSALIMWLGEQITENGIGNGISIILFAGIISRGPAMVLAGVENITSGTLSIPGLLAIVLLALLIVAFVVFISNAERRLPVQYAKRVVGRKMYGGQSSYIPLKVNMTGVLPIIFASSIVSIPITIATFVPSLMDSAFWGPFFRALGYTSPIYAILYFLLIIGFSYFYASMQFNPIEMANNVKKNGGFIPGLRPGKPTSDFITKIMNKIVLIGALSLGLIAAIPIIMSGAFHLGNIALGGTSILIVVGVALETVKQMEATMLMRHYKGFLE